MSTANKENIMSLSTMKHNTLMYSFLEKDLQQIKARLKLLETEVHHLEAGEFAALSKSNKEMRRAMSHIMIKHESEWEVAREENFEPILKYMDEHQLTDRKKMFEDRLEKLAFSPKLLVGEGKTPTFIHPIALVEGFVGSPCYCGRDFTVKEVENIVKELRDKEVNSKGQATVKIEDGYNLFTKKTSIPDTDKTYERFTEELNKTMKKYEINTCIRKIHFLAQSYTESNRFRSTEEEGSLAYLTGKSYYPYYGRGLLQLTWKGKEAGKMGYKQYFIYLGRNDYETKYSEVGSNLEMVMDVSGYFWNRGKLLSKGKILKSKYANAKGIKKNFSKKRVSSPTLTTIDLNQVADDDNVKQVTYLVNGAQSHISERTKYTNFLKEIFDYETCVNKK